MFDLHSYKLSSPYQHVRWEGKDAFHCYKGNLHTHSTASDGEMDFADTIKAYYNAGFDFLAMTDHGVTGRAWDCEPTPLLLYKILRLARGFGIHWLTPAENKAIADGSYPLPDGTPRGKGMLALTGGNELNMLTLTKSHVNGLFIKGGNHFGGFENGYEHAIKFVEKEGGLSFINHPGDWKHTNRDRARAEDPSMIAFFGKILLRHPSCLGIEVFNEKNGATPWDRVLWDRLLLYCLPYGRRVTGFSNGDTHIPENVDSSFCYFMMPSLTVENVCKTMLSGAFFCTTRMLRADPVFGPDEKMDKRGSTVPVPLFTRVETAGHTITIGGRDFDRVQFIADGRVLQEERFTQQQSAGSFTLDLDTVQGAEEFLYVRMQLSGEGGVTLTQPIVLTREEALPVYTQTPREKLQKLGFALQSARAVVYTKAIAGEIRHQIQKRKH